MPWRAQTPPRKDSSRLTIKEMTTRALIPPSPDLARIASFWYWIGLPNPKRPSARPKGSGMSLIDVLDVVRANAPPSPLRRSGWRAWLRRPWRKTPPSRPTLHFQLESPQPGDAVDGHVLRLRGWVCSP